MPMSFTTRMPRARTAAPPKKVFCFCPPLRRGGTVRRALGRLLIIPESEVVDGDNYTIFLPGRAAQLRELADVGQGVILHLSPDAVHIQGEEFSILIYDFPPTSWLWLPSMERKPWAGTRGPSPRGKSPT